MICPNCQKHFTSVCLVCGYDPLKPDHRNAEKPSPLKCRLLWNGRPIATVVVDGYADWPWVSGKLALNGIPVEVRPLLEWVWREANTDEGPVNDPPFPQELMENWFIEKETGERAEISFPVVDFSDGTVEWR